MRDDARFPAQAVRHERKAEGALNPASNVVDVWWAPLEGFDLPSQGTALALLDETEMSRYHAFRADGARIQFLAGRALVRQCLSRYRALQPTDWRFCENAYGRPYIADACGVDGLFFNLSHTDGLVACAIGSFREIGVDVERRDRQTGVEELSETVLAASEKTQLAGLAGAAYREAFLKYWTLKESYLKARGVGLSLPMSSVRFDLAGSPPAALFDPEIGDGDDHWSFRLLTLTGEHIAAVAACAPGGSLTVRPIETSLVQA